MLIALILISLLLITTFYKKTIPVIKGWRKVLLICLRSISIIILLVLLINPIVYFFKTDTVQQSIIVLTDTSKSMDQVGNEGSKLEIFNNKKNKILTRIESSNHKIIDLEFSDGLDGNPTTTNLSKTLVQTFKKYDPQNIRAILLVSDGWFNDNDLEIINNQNIPIYTIDPNFESYDFDLKILDIEHNKSCFVNETTPIRVTLASNNYNEKAKIELVSDKQIIDSKVIDFKEKEFMQITFNPSFSNIGFTPIILRLNADSTEINTDNNSFESAIQVKRGHSKNLVISDVLNWDVKFIISALNEDQNWQSKFLLKNNFLLSLNKVTQLKFEISDVNVLTLINNGNLKFSQNEVEIIIRFVRNGGGLFIIGKPLNELEAISPTLSTNNDITFKSTFSLTKQSEKFSTFSIISREDLQSIPPVSHYYVRSKLQAKELAQFNNEEKSSAILFNTLENGKVLNFVFHDLWKWQLWNSENTYNEFILNVFAWLGQTHSERFYSSLSKNSFHLGEDINIHLHAFDETLAPIVEMEAEISIINSSNKTIYKGFMIRERGRHALTVSDLTADNYHYIISDNVSELQDEGEFMISHVSPESRDTGVNLTLLSFISNNTNGKVINNLADVDIPKANIETIKFSSEIPVYKKWYVITIFLLSFCIELFLRKRWGLL